MNAGTNAEMYDPYIDEVAVSPQRVVQTTPRRIAGYLAVCIGIVIFLVAALGVGQPSEYRYRIGSMQVFEGADGVTIFVATDLVTYRPGFLISARFINRPVRLDRIDVGRSGAVKRLPLKPPAEKSYLLDIDPVVKLRDDLYLLEIPSLGHPLPQLHRIRGDRIESLSVEESEPILRSMGYTGGGDRETDRITEQFGWRLIDRSRLTLTRRREQVMSNRHHLRLRFEVDDLAESLIVESSDEAARWSVPLLALGTRPWKSCGGPPATD
jgi:hypothetical protein